MDYHHVSEYVQYAVGYRVQAKADKNTSMLLNLLDGATLRNYLFENQGGYTFSNQSEAWGMDSKGISHGAAYADWDNDGDLDLVVNNMNEAAQRLRK